MTITNNVEVFCRFEANGKNYYGKISGDKISPLDKAPWDGGTETGTSYEINNVKLLPPSEPKIIVGLGKGYSESWVGKTAPNSVRWFLKPPSSAAADGEDIILPPTLDEVKVECELVIVIGSIVKNADETEAEKAIFGYTIGNDIMGSVDSYHRLQGDPYDMPEPILVPGLKACDGFQPFGPFIYTGIDWKNMKVSLDVSYKNSDETIHHEQNTKTLLYTTAKMVSDISRVFTLSPGDIISTGTIQSYPVTTGAEVKVSIEGMGTLTNKIISGKY